jgi:hypothetical protein
LAGEKRVGNARVLRKCILNTTPANSKAFHESFSYQAVIAVGGIKTGWYWGRLMNLND